jgi:hypothetical protein
MEKLLFVMSEIMKANTFEDATRQQALEIISTMCESNAFLMKKYQGKLQSEVFPAAVVMLTQVENEDDLEAWMETPDEDVLASNDPSSVAAEAISRMAEDLGEKVTIASTT